MYICTCFLTPDALALRAMIRRGAALAKQLAWLTAVPRHVSEPLDVIVIQATTLGSFARSYLDLASASNITAI